MAGYTTIKIRRGNDAELPPLQEGELGYSLDSYTLYSGTDGTRYGVRTIGAFIRDTCAVVIRDKVTLSGVPTVDGIKLSAGDRVLCVAQDLNDGDVEAAKESGRFQTKLGGSWTKCGVYVVAEGAWTQARDFGCLRQYSPYMLVPVKYGPYAGIWAIILTRTSSGAVDKAYWSQIADSFESFTMTDTAGTTVTIKKNDNITFISQLSPSFTPSNGDIVIDASEIAPATLTVVTDEKDPYGNKYTYTLDAAKREHCHDNRYVNITGDTMTGPLILPRDPVEDKEAATKFYVDEHDQQTLEAAQEYAKTYADNNKVHAVNGDDFIVVTTAQNGEQKTVTLALRTTTAENDTEATTKVSRADHLHDGTYLRLDGSVPMTGDIILSKEPADDMGVPTKGYVDNVVEGSASAILTGLQGTNGISVVLNDNDTVTISPIYEGEDGDYGVEDKIARSDHLHDATYLRLDGSIPMTGPLQLSGDDITNENQATTKQFVENSITQAISNIFVGDTNIVSIGKPGLAPALPADQSTPLFLSSNAQWLPATVEINQANYGPNNADSSGVYLPGLVPSGQINGETNPGTGVTEIINLSDDESSPLYRGRYTLNGAGQWADMDDGTLSSIL